MRLVETSPVAPVAGDEHLPHADEAAWASVADAAQMALTLPGLSVESAADLLDVWIGSRIAAGLPVEPRPTTREA